jgi:hypothetical protein
LGSQNKSSIVRRSALQPRYNRRQRHQSSALSVAGSEYDGTVEVWIYVWFLERDHDEKANHTVSHFRFFTGLANHLYRRHLWNNDCSGIWADHPDLYWFWIRRLQVSDVLSDMRISVERFTKVFRRGWLLERDIFANSARGVSRLRPDLLMDYVLLADDITSNLQAITHRVQCAFSVYGPEPPVAMLQPQRLPNRQRSRELAGGFGIRMPQRVVVVEYEHRCAVTQCALACRCALNYLAKEPTAATTIPIAFCFIDYPPSFWPWSHLPRHRLRIAHKRKEGDSTSSRWPNRWHPRSFRIPWKRRIHLPSRFKFMAELVLIEAALDKRQSVR